MKRLMRRSLSVFAILMLFLSLVTVNVIATEYSGEAESVAEKDASTVAEVPQSISMDASEESRFNESINSELNKNLEIENASSIDLNHQLNVTDDEGYLWPVPKCRYISNYFGNGHEGIDIASNSPCDIVAARGGTVIAAQSNTCSHVSARCNCNYGMGNYVQIRQNDGRYSTYMHMKKGTITVSVGQAVNQGDKLGEMGSSGNSTGQHLHYQVTETSTKRVINTNPDVFGYKLEATPKDTTLPIVERVWLDNQAGDGRMLHMEVTDNVNVNRVWCPTFAPGEGEGQYFSKEASRKAGSATEWMCAIFAADHGGKQGEYQTRVYAFDDAGNVSECYVIGYYIDCEIPVIKSVTVTDVSSTGYTVNCTFSDNLGIDRVMFPTWTENNEQDDIYWKQGEVNGNTARCRIVMSDFSCQKDNYITHVYVYDKAFNSAVYGLNVNLKKGNDKIFGEATYQNSRYLLMDDAVAWDEANAMAQAQGGHLAVITSQEEQNVINGLLKKGCQIQYFIGGSRNNGNFVWSTGESLSYTNWSPGEPNNFNNNENCISIFESGKWNDNSNTAYQGYIVEIETKSFKGCIDTPAQSSVIKDDTFIIQGWGIDEHEISKFTYQINGGSENELDRCDRSDVLKTNPSYSTNKPGFKEVECYHKSAVPNCKEMR
ncbi:peptidoglycan DD-metalloendopeptidase family protein [Acetobacterium carbinolicum]|uniref:peptidoglycan DD-metalloendopeptidase family protein n=1 Tax=Acetobacterium carbinolicum TaxID=52690 RepID=UPI003BF4D147